MGLTPSGATPMARFRSDRGPRAPSHPDAEPAGIPPPLHPPSSSPSLPPQPSALRTRANKRTPPSTGTRRRARNLASVPGNRCHAPNDIRKHCPNHRRGFRDPSAGRICTSRLLAGNDRPPHRRCRSARNACGNTRSQIHRSTKLFDTSTRTYHPLQRQGSLLSPGCRKRPGQPASATRRCLSIVSQRRSRRPPGQRQIRRPRNCPRYEVHLQPIVLRLARDVVLQPLGGALR